MMLADPPHQPFEREINVTKQVFAYNFLITKENEGFRSIRVYYQIVDAYNYYYYWEFGVMLVAANGVLVSSLLVGTCFFFFFI